ncbi:MAG: protein-methionine-sulfoxide reductase catalytic subunit MsrP [Pseudomonadota bacterium]
MDRVAKVSNRLRWSDVTPKSDYLNRRDLIAGAGAVAVGAIAGPAMAAKLDHTKSAYSTDAQPNTFEQITNYNNFYEFGTGKDDPAKHAHRLTTKPWSVEIGGLVDKPGNYDLDDLLNGIALEERIYRFRCVEAWSMVIPWIGFELKALLDKVGVNPSAKYVSFETLVRPDEMVGQNYPLLDWPYVEGLRLDEAMHPLTIMATGLYGEEMPNQNGAPIRLVVPWKYGFKSIKSVVKIELTESEPPATWNIQNPREYGFYSNVNPKVDHPRWSQATERVIGQGLLARRRPTLMFNGYADEVADLYAGMDLTTNY